MNSVTTIQQIGREYSLKALKGRLWPESGAMSPIPALDGLRTVAIGLVLLFHAWYHLPGYIEPGRPPESHPLYYGRTGVHLFFVLSGFLLFLPYARWIYGFQKRPSTPLFYKRRALRVGPAYWTSLVILTKFGPWSLAALGDLLVHAVFLSNVVPASIFSINGVFWTMAIEVQFYVTLPGLAWLIWCLSRRMDPIAAVLVTEGAMAALMFASDELYRTRLGSMPLFSGFLVGETSLTDWLVVFGLGILCSMIYTYFKKVAPPQPTAARRLETIGTTLFVSGGPLALLTALAHPSHGSIVQLSFGAAYVSMLFGILFGAPLIRHLFEARPVRFVGLISYSFYIWQSIVLRLIEPGLRGLPLMPQIIVRFIVGGALSVVVAYVSYQLVERPFISARRQSHETADVRVA